MWNTSRIWYFKINDFLGDNISIIYDKKNANQLYFDDNGYVIDNKFKKIVNSDFQEFIDKVIYEKTLCYEGIQSVQFLSSKGKITVNTDSKFMAFWCNENYNFICVEGWDVIPDLIDNNHKLEEKVGINEISPKQRHKIRYSLKFER